MIRPVNAVVHLVDAVIQIVETVSAPIEVFAAPVAVFVAFVDWMAISIHNMNRDEKYYDSAATVHDDGKIQNH